MSHEESLENVSESGNLRRTRDGSVQGTVLLFYLSFIALWPSHSWVAEAHLSCCATDGFYGCFDSKGSIWEPAVVCLR